MENPSKRAARDDGAARILDDETRVLRRLLAIFPRFYLPLLLLLIAAWTWRPLEGNEDFWAHAAVGRWIWQNQSVPQETLWLWSTPPEKWLAHSWLSQLIFHALMQSGGASLVLLFTIVFVALPFTCLWRVWAQRGRINAFAPLVFVFAIGCASVRFQPRPELFSYFFLSVLWLHLLSVEGCETRMPRSGFVTRFLGMAAMFALWANCHGGVVLGLVVLLLTALCQWAQTRSLRSATPLFGLLFLCALAINLNPYGFEYWQALRPVGGAMFSMIDEWKSPLREPALPTVAITLVLLAVWIALLLWMRNPDRRWAHLSWLLFFTVMFFLARRNLWPLMLCVLVVAAANAKGLSTLRLTSAGDVTQQLKIQVLARTGAVAFLVAWLISAVSPQAIQQEKGKLRARAVSRFAPDGVANYVKAHRVSDPIFNDYLRSGYFHWRFAGRPKLFIDLLNAYPPQLLKEYFEIIGRTARGRKRFEELKINTVIFGRHDKSSRLAPLAEYLNSNADEWRRAYSGEDGTVWVRRNANALQ